MAAFLIPLAIGAATAASKGIQAYGQYQSQVDATRAQNRADQRDFQYRKSLQAFERQRELKRYEIAKKQYETDKREIYTSLGKNYNALQRQLDNAYRTAFYEEQNESIALAKSLGRASTKGLSGKTAERMDAAQYQQRGRNQAMRAQNLLESGYRYKDQAEIARDTAYGQVRRAYSNVAMAPMFGPDLPAPVARSMPNRFGLYSGLLGAAVGGVSTAASLSPEGNIFNLFRKPTG